jgi:hypothetical protein
MVAAVKNRRGRMPGVEPIPTGVLITTVVLGIRNPLDAADGDDVRAVP